MFQISHILIYRLYIYHKHYPMFRSTSTISPGSPGICSWFPLCFLLINIHFIQFYGISTSHFIGTLIFPTSTCPLNLMASSLPQFWISVTENQRWISNNLVKLNAAWTNLLDYGPSLILKKGQMWCIYNYIVKNF